MPISVTCPGCLTRFTVSDKYAGKKGPCPKCKKELVVPDKTQEVVIHAPELSGPKDSKGTVVLKPLKRAEFKLSKTETIVAVALTVLCLGMSLYARFAFAQPPTWILAMGVVVLSFPLAWIGYTFFHDDELAEYSGKERNTRVGICAAIFALTWGLYWMLSSYMGNKVLADVDPLQFAVFIALMFLAGTVGSLAVMELEVGQSLMHYAMFFGITLLLAMVAGLELADPLSNGSSDPINKITNPTLNRLPTSIKPNAK
ncbi:MAG: hypothetical protein ABL921_20510 [Pirellula sp.]